VRVSLPRRGIIDFWRLKRAPHWDQLHSDVIRKILSKARAGTVVTFVPGNHDEYLRRFCDLHLGNIMITREAIHRTVDARVLLVTHGDEFDGITRYHRWIAVTGDVGYEMLLVLTGGSTGRAADSASRTGASPPTSRARPNGAPGPRSQDAA
jgi:UDP-2,3-diacylglucosamine pyrophosphatase LpxH